MRGREPILLGVIGAVLGIGLAVLLFGGGFGGGTAGASASPSAGAALSPATSPSLVAVATVAPSVEVTVAPPTDAPTAPPTARPTKTPKPTPTANTNPVIIEFVTPKQEDCTNDTAGQITVSWRIARATGVTISIDGPGVFMSYPGPEMSGVLLPYGCGSSPLKHTYTITTVGGTGPAATITRTVRTRAPSVEAFALTPVTECGPGETNATLRLSYTVRAATGADLYWDGAIYAHYSGKVNGPIPISYDCSKASITYKLVTTGGYGPADSATLTISKP